MAIIKVLLVDDEKMIKKVLQDKVDWTRFNMEIAGAVSSAKEALDFIQCFDVDLIITDMKMPKMDGNTFIEHAAKKNKPIRFLVLSAYTEFDMVRRSFKLGVYDYLQKSDINTSKMNDILMKLSNEITHDLNKKNKNSSKLLSSYELEDGYIQENKNYSIICVELMTDGLDYYILDQIIEKKNAESEYMIMNCYDNTFTLLIEHKKQSARYMNDETEAAIEKIKAVLNNKIYMIGISSVGLGASINLLQEQARKAMEGSYYISGEQMVFYHRTMEFKKKESAKTTSSYWNSLIMKKINSLEIIAVSGIINEMMNYLSNIHLDKDVCAKLVFDVYYFYCHYIIDNNILDLKNVIETDHNVVYNTVKQFEKFSMLESWIKSNVEIIYNRYMLYYKTNIIGSIKVYVALNITVNLTLKKLSEYYGVSSSYISNIFKRSEGIPLKKYINNVRLKKGRDYLVNTNMKIKDICEIIGYSSPEHFSRSFKECYGLSPYQYRQSFQDK